MLRLAIISGLVFSLAGVGSAQVTDQAVVKDASANFVAALFMSACIPSVGKPDEVEKWAVAHHLNEIHDPTALAIFVGPGDGKAWGVPQTYGSFALSLRGKTKACAAWARNANGEDAEKLFRLFIEGVRRPSMQVTLVQDAMVDVSGERRHAITYTIHPIGASVGGTAIIQTTRRSEGDALVEMELAAPTW